MTEYYFLGVLLPTLSIGVKPEFSVLEFCELLSMNLTVSDSKKVEDLLRPIDFSNIRALGLGLPFDNRGNFTSKELEEALLVKDGLPEYIIAYLEKYESLPNSWRYLSALYVSFYQEMQKSSSVFLVKYFAFDREVRLCLMALRAKLYGKDLVRELQFEDLSDPFVMDILAQKDSPTYEPPQEYEALKAIVQLPDPKEQYGALLKFRFDSILEMEESEHFSIDAILGFMARLMIVESWEFLNVDQGRVIVEDLSRYG